MDLIRMVYKLRQDVDGLIKPEVSRWQDWTPAVTQSGSVTITITYARYIASDNIVHLMARLVVTGSGTTNNAIIISGIPAAVQPANVGGVIGSFWISDVGTPSNYVGIVQAVGADDLRFIVDNVTNYTGATPNFGLGATDVISFQATYER